MFLHILHTVDFIEIVLIIFGFWFFEWHTHFVGGGPNAFNPFHISGFSLYGCNIQTNKCKFLVNVVFKMRKSFQWTKLSAVGCHQFRGHQHHFWTHLEMGVKMRRKFARIILRTFVMTECVQVYSCVARMPDRLSTICIVI